MEIKTIKYIDPNPYLDDILEERIPKFFYYYIKRNISKNIRITDRDVPDILIYRNYTKKIEDKKYKDCIKIFEAVGENQFSGRVISLYNFFLFFSHRFKSFFLIKLAFKLIPFKILTFPLFEIKFRENQNILLNNKIHKIITTNKVKRENVLSLPFFMTMGGEVINKIKNKKVNKTKKKFCAFIVSNFNSYERIDFFKRLSKYKKVDSYGRVFRNCEYPKEIIKKYGGGYAINPIIYKDYKFVICFENSFVDEYITEKLLNAMLGGAIPIYRGAPNVGKYFNTKSFINYDDHEKSYKKMIEKIIELDNDEEKYEQFLKQSWMTKQNIKNVEKKEKELEKFFKIIF